MGRPRKFPLPLPRAEAETQEPPCVELDKECNLIHKDGEKIWLRIPDRIDREQYRTNPYYYHNEDFIQIYEGLIDLMRLYGARFMDLLELYENTKKFVSPDDPQNYSEGHRKYIPRELFDKWNEFASDNTYWNSSFRGAYHALFRVCTCEATK